MPSKWQREFTCDWCASIKSDVQGELRVRSWSGWKTQWRLCRACTNHLFELRGQQTYGSVTAFAEWQKQVGE
jgi:hypothetical protein